MLHTHCPDPEGFDAVVYFGHGWKHGLSSAGFKDRSQEQVEDLALAIAMTSKHEYG